MSVLVDWVEKSAVENLKDHHHSADVLARESVTTLTVLLAGLGGALAYGMKSVENESWTWLSVGTLCTTFYLAVLAWILVRRCLMIDVLPAIYYEPGGIDLSEHTLDSVRSEYLAYLQRAINTAAKRNGIRANCLNRIRMAAVLTPVFFCAVATVWYVMA